MRTDGPPAAENADGTSLSRRAFVVAGGSATGTVLGSGLATADRTAPVVAATAPYRPAVREAAGAVPVPIEVDSVGAAGDAPAVLVSGRPVPDDERVELRDVVVDGTAALRSPDGTWRDVVARSAVRRRWAAETSVETWSEYEGTEPLESVEEVRPDVDDRTATLVRGTRA